MPQAFHIPSEEVEKPAAAALLAELPPFRANTGAHSDADASVAQSTLSVEGVYVPTARPESAFTTRQVHHRSKV